MWYEDPNGGGTVSGTSLANFNASLRSVNFTFSRTGNVVSYRADDRIWTSATQAYFSDINAFEFRIRSATGDNESLTNLLYNGTSLADISAAQGNVTIQLYSGVSGDFTLTGTFNTSGAVATGWNHQIKGLDLPGPLSVVPEPSTLLLSVVAVSGIGLLRLRKSRFRQKLNTKPRSG